MYILQRLRKLVIYADVVPEGGPGHLCSTSLSTTAKLIYRRTYYIIPGMRWNASLEKPSQYVVVGVLNLRPRLLLSEFIHTLLPPERLTTLHCVGVVNIFTNTPVAPLCGLVGSLEYHSSVSAMGLILYVEFCIRKRHQLWRTPAMAWVGSIRPESTRGESAERLSRQMCKVLTAAGTEKEEPTM